MEINDGQKMSEGSFCTILKQSCSPKDNQLFSPTVFFIESKIYIEAELQDLLKIISLYMPNYAVKWPKVMTSEDPGKVFI